MQEPSVAPLVSELPQVLGVEVPKAGWYLDADDVSAWLARFAEQFRGESRAALLDAARAFAPQDIYDAPDDSYAPDVVEQPVDTAAPTEPHEVDDGRRIEAYPNEDGSYWYARLVDQEGRIIDGPIGHVSREDAVVADALRRWPGTPVHILMDALSDSVWSESNPAATWNGRQRPSDRRLFQR